MMSEDKYSYEKAGFDAFLSRSIDNTPQFNLDSRGPVSRQVAYDRTQVTGTLGDTLQIGQVRVNRTNITMSDGTNERLLIGEDKGGF
jgi:hypothetical protein